MSRLQPGPMVPKAVQDELWKEIHEVIADPDRWLDSVNDQLGGRKPKEWIAEGQGELVRDLIRVIKHGLFT